MIIQGSRFYSCVLGCSLAIVSCLPLLCSSSVSLPQSVLVIDDHVGTWEQIDQRDLTDNEITILKADRYWQRVYQCTQSAQTVTATWMSGAGGPMASHQPDICYVQSDYQSPSHASVWKAKDLDVQFRFQSLKPRRIDQPEMTIAYAWHDGQRWTSPRFPRFQLAGHPRLQRILISMRHPSAKGDEAQDVIKDFIVSTLVTTQHASESNEAGESK